MTDRDGANLAPIPLLRCDGYHKIELSAAGNVYNPGCRCSLAGTIPASLLPTWIVISIGLGFYLVGPLGLRQFVRLC